MHFLSRSQVCFRLRQCLQSFQRDALFEGDPTLCLQLHQALQRSLHILVFIALYDFAFRANDLGRKHARAVKIEPWIERFLIERIDGFSVLLGDMFVAHVLAHHTGILALCQRVIVTVARARFGLFDAQFLKDSRHWAVDVLGTVVRVKAQNHKRKLFDD